MRLASLEAVTTHRVTHWNALLHPWHTLNTRYTLHIALHRSTTHIRRAIRAKGPAQFQQTFTLWAGTFELLATGWADLKIRLDARVTIITCLALGHLSQERFLF